MATPRLLLVAAVLGSLGCALSAPPPAAPTRGARGADLLIQQEEGAVTIRGIFANEALPAGELTYALEATKEGPSGTSRSRQGGAFETRPGQTDTLSSVRLGVQPGDRLHIHLTVRTAAGVVGEAHAERTF